MAAGGTSLTYRQRIQALILAGRTEDGVLQLANALAQLGASNLLLKDEEGKFTLFMSSLASALGNGWRQENGTFLRFDREGQSIHTIDFSGVEIDSRSIGNFIAGILCSGGYLNEASSISLKISGLSHNVSHKDIQRQINARTSEPEVDLSKVKFDTHIAADLCKEAKYPLLQMRISVDAVPPGGAALSTKGAEEWEPHKRAPALAKKPGPTGNERRGCWAFFSQCFKKSKQPPVTKQQSNYGATDASPN